jgi:hypothetical protein
MSALGQKRTLASELGMSALPLKADMLSVSIVPNADIRRGLNQLSELASGFDLLRVWWPVYRPELICRRPEYLSVCGIHELRGFMNL